MLNLFIIKWAFKNLTRNLKRSILNGIGIAAAVFSVLLMCGFANYSYHGLSEKFANYGNGHIQIGKESFFKSYSPEKFRISTAAISQIKNSLLNHKSIKDKIQTFSFKRKFSGIIGTYNKSEIFQGEAIEPSSYSVISSSLKFSVPNGIENMGKFDLVIGKSLSERLEVKIGDVISLLVTTDNNRTNAMDFTLAGIIETGSKQLDSVFLITHVTATLQLLNSHDVDILMVGLHDIKNTKYVEKIIKEEIIGKQEIKELGVRTWDQLAEYYRSVKSLYERIIGVVKIVLAIISILSVSTSMLIISHERRGEVAMLKAIGMYSRSIISLFITEGIIVAIIGGLLGFMSTFFIAWVINIVGGLPMPPPPGDTESYSLKLLINFKDVVNTFVAFVFFSAIATYIAVRKSKKMYIPENLVSLIFITISSLFLFIYSPNALSESNIKKGSETAHETSMAQILFDKWEQIRGVNDSNIVVDTVFDYMNEKKEIVDSTTFRVASNEEFVLAIAISEHPGNRMIILSNSDGLWMQKENMRKPLKVSPNQRLIGQASNGDVVSIKWSKEFLPFSFSSQVLNIVPRKNSLSSTYSKIELLWNESLTHPIKAKFYAFSGKLLKTAFYHYETKNGNLELKSSLIEDSLTNLHSTLVRFGKVKKMKLPNGFFNPEVMISSGKKLVLNK